jgi:hypothetical protein
MVGAFSEVFCGMVGGFMVVAGLSEVFCAKIDGGRIGKIGGGDSVETLTM